MQITIANLKHSASLSEENGDDTAMADALKLV